jgi:hypothetical protein
MFVKRSCHLLKDCYMLFTGWHVFTTSCTYLSFCLPFSVRPLMVLHQITHSDIPHSGLGIVPSETSARDRHPCPRRDFNPQFQQAKDADTRVRSRGHRDRPSTRLCCENLTFRVPKGKRVAAWHGADAY